MCSLLLKDLSFIYFFFIYIQSDNSVMWIIIFHNAYCTHQNKCSVPTDNTTAYKFSEDPYSNLSFRIKLIDKGTRMDKTI